jgi:hypothetical protein
MSYLRYLCLFAHRGVQHILYCVFVLLCLFSSCVRYVASFSGLSTLIAPSVFFNVYHAHSLVSSVQTCNSTTYGVLHVSFIRECLFLCKCQSPYDKQ